MITLFYPILRGTTTGKARIVLKEHELPQTNAPKGSGSVRLGPPRCGDCRQQGGGAAALQAPALFAKRHHRGLPPGGLPDLRRGHGVRRHGAPGGDRPAGRGGAHGAQHDARRADLGRHLLHAAGTQGHRGRGRHNQRHRRRHGRRRDVRHRGRAASAIHTDAWRQGACQRHTPHGVRRRGGRHSQVLLLAPRHALSTGRQGCVARPGLRLRQGR